VRILVVMIEPPLPFAAAASRWYYVLLRELFSRNHRVTAFVACRTREDLEETQRLFPRAEYDVRCYGFRARPGLKGKWANLRRPYSYMFSSELEQDLARECANGFDVLHLEHQWSGWLGQKHAGRVLLNLHWLNGIDLAQKPPHNFRARCERAVMIATERHLIRAFRHHRTLSSRLQGEVLRINPTADVVVVPFAFDLSQYRFEPAPVAPVKAEPVIGLIGSMQWYPTYSAAERFLTRLWPQIRRRVPGARAQVVGRSAKSALAGYLNTPGVTFEEDVPDIQPYFASMDLMLYAPARGSGMKVKVLEALAWGIPVVTTSEGVEGLPAIDGVHAGVCEDDAGLIERSVQLLQDPERAAKQRTLGRALVEEHCSPRAAVDALERIYERIAAASGRG
jgi:glycosyltransferase involved in cell wall biosynthesis